MLKYRQTCHGAGKQHHAQFFLQLLDGARQWRLLDVKPLGGTAEVKFLSYGQEATKMT